MVVGCSSLQKAHKILLLIKHEEFDYVVTHCLSVDMIISPIPEVHHGKIIDQEYAAYVAHSTANGITLAT